MKPDHWLLPAEALEPGRNSSQPLAKIPSRYFCVVAILHNHQGAPATSAVSSARL